MSPGRHRVEHALIRDAAAAQLLLDHRRPGPLVVECRIGRVTAGHAAEDAPPAADGPAPRQLPDGDGLADVGGADDWLAEADAEAPSLPDGDSVALGTGVKTMEGTGTGVGAGVGVGGGVTAGTGVGLGVGLGVSRPLPPNSTA